MPVFRVVLVLESTYEADSQTDAIFEVRREFADAMAASIANYPIVATGAVFESEEES